MPNPITPLGSMTPAMQAALAASQLATSTPSEGADSSQGTTVTVSEATTASPSILPRTAPQPRNTAPIR